MSNPTWTLGGTFGGAQKRHAPKGATARTAAMRALGPVVYAVRLADGVIKIGWTERFDLRLHWLKHRVRQDVELLAFRPGTYDEEQAIHAALKPHRATDETYAQAREYYVATPEVLAVVNDMRGALNMPQLAA